MNSRSYLRFLLFQESKPPPFEDSKGSGARLGDKSELPG